jgi:hypothetical protein
LRLETGYRWVAENKFGALRPGGEIGRRFCFSGCEIGRYVARRVAEVQSM